MKTVMRNRYLGRNAKRRLENTYLAWSYGKNERGTTGREGVESRSKWSEAERKTKKEMDGWGGKSFGCAW